MLDMILTTETRTDHVQCTAASTAEVVVTMVTNQVTEATKAAGIGAMVSRPRYGGYSVGLARGRHGSPSGSYSRYGRIARRRSRFGNGNYGYDSDNDFYNNDYGYGYDDDFNGYDDDYRGYGRRYGYRSQPGIYARRGHALYGGYSGNERYRGYGYDGTFFVISF